MTALRRRLTRSLVERASQRYFAGPDIEHAIALHQHLEQRGFETTLGYWDSAGETSANVVGMYRDSISAIQHHRANSYFSIKPWVFHFRNSEFEKIRAHADCSGVGLHLDALEWAWADKGFALLEGSSGPRPVGCTLPSRWRRSIEDASRVMALGCPVRIVKGQRPDPTDPQRDPVDGFLELARRFAERGYPTRVASHDPRVVSEVLRLFSRFGVAVELELLYGLPVRPVLAAAKAMNVRTRIYVPYGRGFLPYSLGAVRRRPGVAWWLLKDLLLPGDRLPAPVAVRTSGVAADEVGR